MSKIEALSNTISLEERALETKGLLPYLQQIDESVRSSRIIYGMASKASQKRSTIQKQRWLFLISCRPLVSLLGDNLLIFLYVPELS